MSFGERSCIATAIGIYSGSGQTNKAAPRDMIQNADISTEIDPVLKLLLVKSCEIPEYLLL